jgi:outer membrane protein assembly factor BamA
MRIRILPVLISVFGLVAVAQNRPGSPSGVCRIHQLMLVSNDLPATERNGIVLAFEGGSYDINELAERVRFKLRDSGYAFAEVGEPRLTRIPSGESTCNADISFAVHAGDQYRLSGITFEAGTGGSVFSPAQLRSQFPLEDGAVFNATAFGKGLEKLMDLYTSAGYANFGVIPKPQFDTARHTVTLTIDIDQGRSLSFGKLSMEGVEPRAGAAQQLLASWKELEGKLYNPQLLRDWLKRNSAEQVYSENVASADPGTLNVLVRFR